MANEKISDQDAAAPLLLTDHVLVARGAAPPNLKATIGQVLALGGGVGGGGTIDRIPIFTSPNVLGNSRLGQSAGAVNVLSGDFVVDVGDASIGAGLSPRARLEVGTGKQWSANNFGANIVISGTRNNVIGFLDAAGGNPWAIGAKATGNLEFNAMPALGDVVTAPILGMTLARNGDLTLPTGDVEITEGMLGIGNAPTLPLDVGAVAGITDIGGYAIKLTNKTGSNTIKGQLVIASTAFQEAFATAGASSSVVIGVVLENGIADGSEAWVMQSGIALVLMDAGGINNGDRIGASATAGSATELNSPPTSPDHFTEIGHALTQTGGAGLVKAAIHLL